MGKDLQKLQKRHHLFVDYYLECFDATQAAIKAGYSGKYVSSTACQLKQDPLIKAEIESKFKEMMIERGIQKEYLIDKLLMVIEEAEKRNSKGAMKLDTIVKCIDTMAKIGGFYQDNTTNVSVSQQIGNNIKVEIVGGNEDQTEDVEAIEIDNDNDED